MNEALSERLKGAGGSYELGILFVHGMGEQKRGDTLTEAGDALVQWLERWCERPPHGTRLRKGDVRVIDASLRAAQPDDLDPAHLVVCLTLPRRSDDPGKVRMKTVRWALAESWWAEGFQPATFGQLVGWVIGIGPWWLATQFHGVHDRMHLPASGPWWVRRLLWPAAIFTLAALLAAAVLVSLMVTVLALVVLLLRLVPIGPVQALAEGVQRSLASSFGDLMVLVQSPSRFAAMRSQVRRDVQTLLHHCDKVAVIAHSQGSHIAWEAIRRPVPDENVVPPNPLYFFTYGQAMRKLRLAYAVSRQELDGGNALVAALSVGAQVALFFLLAMGVLTLTSARGWLTAAGAWFTTWSPVDAVVVPLGLIVLFVGGNAVLLYRSRREMGRVERLLARDVRAATRGRSAFRWIDLWSSADPAPNGPLAGRKIKPIESWRIRNQGSVLLDHSIYWQNTTEFVGAVALEMGRLGAGTAHFPDDSDPFPSRRLQLAALSRAARVQVLSMLRMLWIGAAMAGGIQAFPVLAHWLRFDWIPANVPVLDLFRGGLPTIVAGGVIGLVALAGWVVIKWLWGIGVQADDRAYFKGVVEGPFPWPSWLGLGLLVAVPLAAAGWLSKVGEPPFLAPAYLLTMPVIVLAVMTFVTGGGRGFADPDGVHEIPLRGRRLVVATISVVALGLMYLALRQAQDGAPAPGLVDVVAYFLLLAPMAWCAAMGFRRFLNEHERLRRQPTRT